MTAMVRDWAPGDREAAALQAITDASFPSNAASNRQSYVDPQRLDELRAMKSADWDFSRLVRLCEELNCAWERDLWMGCAMLMRGIADHVPPIFGFATFGEVANNHAGGQSFRRQMQRLQGSLRDIADAALHNQIRRKETLPTATSVDFRADLDALLAEIVRLTK